MFSHVLVIGSFNLCDNVLAPALVRCLSLSFPFYALDCNAFFVSLQLASALRP